MNIATTQALTINDILTPNMMELSDEDLVSVFGGSVTVSDGIALGGVIVGAGAFFGAPLVVAFGAGFAIGSFLGGAFGGY